MSLNLVRKKLCGQFVYYSELTSLYCIAIRSNQFENVTEADLDMNLTKGDI